MRGEETDGAAVVRKMLSEAGFQIWCIFLSICSRMAGGGGFFSDLIPLWKWWKPRLVVTLRSTEGMHGDSRLTGEGRLPRRTSRLRRRASLGRAPHRLHVVATGVVTTDRESSRYTLLKAVSKLQRRRQRMLGNG
ncbi:LOW QUALITY PROTEIN: hypothetical protein YC2023_018735 [Brassica napus]